jgi:uncharacterized membrane protein
MNGDPVWMRALLAVHVVCGFGAFLLAPVALVTAKGGKAHKRWGMVYLWCMGGLAATALPMAVFRPVLFLALVAVFSFYAAFAGYRVLRLKDLPRGGKARAIDWIAAGVTVVDGLALAWLGAFHPEAIQMRGFGVVGVVFGLIALRLAYAQMKTFVAPPKEKMFWWYEHLGNFIGSYIAAWSAFSVVTLSRYLGNAWYVWLWPSMIGIPAIVVTTAYYKRKFAPKSALAV